MRQRKILKKIQKYFDTAPKLEKIFYKCMIILPVDFSIKLLYTVYYIDYFKYLVGVRVMEGFQQAVAEKQDGNIRLSWHGENLGEVKIYQAEDPDFQETADTLVGSTNEESYMVSMAAGTRPYFLLVGENGARIRIAERVIPMDGLVNFSDVGGYLTEDGHRTKWGKLLRSAAHDNISENDMAFLQKIGLKTVVDYRSGYEVNGHPDKQIAGVAYQALRPFEDSNATNILDLAQFEHTSVEEAVRMLTTINRTLASHPHCNEVYRQLVLIALKQEQVPVVQHCTAGKDRVGVGSATLLMALGVPRDVIMQDYLLSNYNRLSVDKLTEGATGEKMEIPPEQLKLFEALTKVHEEYLGAFFDEVDTHWGGTEGYLKNALGLTDEQLAKMRELYLEQM